MQVSLIAAIGKNNELGKEGKLLWHLPLDFKHFKDLTTGHPIIMGRKTFESIGHPLPNRTNIVITNDRAYKTDGIEVYHSLEDALKKFEATEAEVFIIGGGQIYTQALPEADTLYITHVDGSFDADTFFPKIDTDIWKIVSQEDHTKNENHQYNFSFVTYKRL